MLKQFLTEMLGSRDGLALPQNESEQFPLREGMEGHGGNTGTANGARSRGGPVVRQAAHGRQIFHILRIGSEEVCGATQSAAESRAQRGNHRIEGDAEGGQ